MRDRRPDQPCVTWRYCENSEHRDKFDTGIREEHRHKSPTSDLFQIPTLLFSAGAGASTAPRVFDRPNT